MVRRFHSIAVSRYVFILPGFVLFSFAVLIPFLMGVNIAFTDWNGINTTYNYIGFENFINLFEDPQLGQPIANSFAYAFFGLIGNTVVSLSLALLVNNQMLQKGRLRCV